MSSKTSKTSKTSKAQSKGSAKAPAKAPVKAPKAPAKAPVKAERTIKLFTGEKINKVPVEVTFAVPSKLEFCEGIVNALGAAEQVRNFVNYLFAFAVYHGLKVESGSYQGPARILSALAKEHEDLKKYLKVWQAASLGSRKIVQDRWTYMGKLNSKGSHEDRPFNLKALIGSMRACEGALETFDSAQRKQLAKAITSLADALRK